MVVLEGRIWLLSGIDVISMLLVGNLMGLLLKPIMYVTVLLWANVSMLLELRVR